MPGPTRRSTLSRVSRSISGPSASFDPSHGSSFTRSSLGRRQVRTLAGGADELVHAVDRLFTPVGLHALHPEQFIMAHDAGDAEPGPELQSATVAQLAQGRA